MQVKQLAATAAKVRALGLDMVYKAASGHLGGSFSAAMFSRNQPHGGKRFKAANDGKRCRSGKFDNMHLNVEYA